MKIKLKTWQIIGFIFTCVLGILLHFLYDLTGGSILVMPFSAINESIFEHMKLLFFPMFIFALIQSRYMEESYQDFWCVKFFGISCGTILIPVLYYTLNGAFGTLPDRSNIAIFFVTAAVSYILEAWLFGKENKICSSGENAFLALCLIAVIMASLTFLPLDIPLFWDPLSR